MNGAYGEIKKRLALIKLYIGTFWRRYAHLGAYRIMIPCVTKVS
jgi:hypothetical protein